LLHQAGVLIYHCMMHGNMKLEISCVCEDIDIKFYCRNLDLHLNVGYAEE